LWRLGDDIFAPQKQPIRVKKADVAPLVTFTFKYRSFGLSLFAVRNVDTIINARFFLEMLKANGIVPIAAENKRSAATQSAVEDVKPEIIDIEDGADEIKALEVSFCASFRVSVVEHLSHVI